MLQLSASCLTSTLISDCSASESATRPSGPTSVTSAALDGTAAKTSMAASRALLRTRVVHAHRALDGDDVRGARERRRRLVARGPRPADRLEEVFEAVRRDQPHHDEILVAVVDDLVLDVIAEKTRGAGDERLLRAVDHDVTAAAKADLQLDLVAVRMLAHAAAGRDRLVTHRQRGKARQVRRELRIGVTVGGNGLPVRRTLVRLNDHGVSTRPLARAHDSLRPASVPQPPGGADGQQVLSGLRL